MAKYNQADLMNAHKQARQSAHEATLSSNPADNAIEVVSKPTAFEDTEHPFSGNRNNQRVAERLARQSKAATQASTELPKTPQQAADADLAKAREYESDNPDEFIDTEDDGGSLDGISRALNGKGAATLLAPLATVGDANDDSKNGSSGAGAPPPPPPPPAFKG